MFLFMSLEKIYSYHLLELYSFIWKYSTFEIFIFAIYLLFAITKKAKINIALPQSSRTTGRIFVEQKRNIDEKVVNVVNP